MGRKENHALWWRRYNVALVVKIRDSPEIAAVIFYLKAMEIKNFYRLFSILIQERGISFKQKIIGPFPISEKDRYLKIKMLT